MKLTIVIACLVPLVHTPFAPKQPTLPNVQKVLQHMRDAFLNAKTYKADYQCRMTMRDKGSTTLRIVLKTVPEKKLYFRVSPTGAGSGELGARTMALRFLAIDNGKVGWAYIETLNQYMTGPHATSWFPITASYGIVLPNEFRPNDSKFRLIGSKTLNGSKVLVLDASGQKTSGIGRFYVDAKTFRFRGMEMAGMNKGEPMTVATTLITESVYGPLTSSTFEFTPPPGARQIQPPMNKRTALE